MDLIKPNPILKFKENQLNSIRKALGYEDVSKLKQDIEHLKDWIKLQNHFSVKDFDEEYLERLLIYNKGSIERTKQKLDKLCTCTNLMPEFLQNYDIRNEFKPVFNVSNMGLLPQPTAENYRVFVSNLSGEDDPKFELIDFYRYMIVISHYLLSHDYCHGLEIIGDSRNVTFNTASKLNPITVHKGMTLINEALSQRIKKIHLLSGSSFFDAILTLFKQGLSTKLKERIVIHPNVESLHEYIPKEQLPKELGGSGPSMREIRDTIFEEISSDEHIARMKFMEKLGTDEAYRLASTFNEEYSGRPGSFKTLCLD